MTVMDPRPPTPRTLELARERLDQALSGNPTDVGLLVLRARADERTGRYAEAATYFERAAELARTVGDRSQEGDALHDCGLALSRAGFDDEALDAYRGALVCFDLLLDAERAASTRMAIAKHHLAHRRLEEARHQLEQCLAGLPADASSRGWAHEKLRHIAETSGALEEALEHARTGVRLAAQHGDRAAFGIRLMAVGRLHHEAGHQAKARSYLCRALPYLREMGQHGPLLQSLLIIAERSPRAQAVACLNEALEVVDAEGTTRKQGHVRLLLADQLMEGDPSRARALLAEAVVQFREAGDPESSAPAWLKLAVLQHRLGDEAEAQISRDRARKLFEIIGDRGGVERVSALFDIW